MNDFWALDYRVFDPDRDGKTKLDHVENMLRTAIQREVQFTAVLMDTWYATTKLMLQIHDLKKVFYCPIKSNRLRMTLKKRVAAAGRLSSCTVKRNKGNRQENREDNL